MCKKKNIELRVHSLKYRHNHIFYHKNPKIITTSRGFDWHLILISLLKIYLCQKEINWGHAVSGLSPILSICAYESCSFPPLVIPLPVLKCFFLIWDKFKEGYYSSTDRLPKSNKYHTIPSNINEWIIELRFKNRIPLTNNQHSLIFDRCCDGIRFV